MRQPSRIDLLRSPLELRAVATINSELSPLGAATVAALCAEPTHTFQIPAGSVAAGRSPPAPPMWTVGLGYTQAGTLAALLHRLLTVGARGSWHGSWMGADRGRWRVGR